MKPFLIVMAGCFFMGCASGGSRNLRKAYLQEYETWYAVCAMSGGSERECRKSMGCSVSMTNVQCGKKLYGLRKKAK